MGMAVRIQCLTCLQARQEAVEARGAAEAASRREAEAWRDVTRDTTRLRHDGLSLLGALQTAVRLLLRAAASMQHLAAVLGAATASKLDGCQQAVQR